MLYRNDVMYYLGIENHQLVQLIDDYYNCINILKSKDKSLIFDS